MLEINETVRTSKAATVPQLFWIKPPTKVRTPQVATKADGTGRPSILEKRRRRQIRMMAH